MASPDRDSVLSTMRTEYAAVESLLLTEDPEATPYKSKYAARERLDRLVAAAEEKLEAPLSKALAVNFLARLGAVDHEVEELNRSQEDLEKALRLAEDKEADGIFVMAVLVCLNQLGILWCTRGDFDKSKDYLFRSLDVYRTFKSRHDEDQDPSDVHDLLDAIEEERSTSEKKLRNLDLLNTHTYYFLAQVHEKTGQAEKAGEFCHTTLRRQLELGEYKPLDWATNAYTLSHHYLVTDRFALARHHIGAARFMLEKYRVEVEGKLAEHEDLKEAVDRTSACIHRAVGRYALVLLQKSRERLQRGEEEDLAVEDVEGLDLNRDEEFRSRSFSGVVVPEEVSSLPARLAGDFDSAREIFLPGQRALNRCKEEFFTMEEHCTDFVEAQRDLSALHKNLAQFEPDPVRRFKIHKRRVALLEGPLNELAKEHYLMVMRQLMYELAETHEAMMDAKMEEGAGRGAVSHAKVNSVIDAAVKYFEQYLDALKDPATGADPARYYADSVRPALAAHFHLARLWDKYLVPERSRRRLENKIRSLHHFRKMVDYCDRNPESEEVVAAELPLCREMAKLLPIKIEKMRMELREDEERAAAAGTGN